MVATAMHRFGVAVKVLIRNEERKYLIIKKTNDETKEDHHSSLYDLPGGRVEYGESLRQALQRELFEEIGIKVDGEMDLLDATSFLRKDGLQLTIITYFLEVENIVVELSHEHDCYRWVDMNYYDSMPCWIIRLMNQANLVIQ